VHQLSDHDPRFPDGTEFKITTLLYFYLFAASEHLGALGALYTMHEVLIPPPTVVRSVLEHSAAATWVLGCPPEPVEDRLARAYLEELMSAEEAKKASGRLLGKDHAEYKVQAAGFKALRGEAEAVFGEACVDADGQSAIRGHRRLGPLETVARMLGTMGQPLETRAAHGVYDYLSNLSHPTLYPHHQMWQLSERDDGPALESNVTVADHDKQIRIAVMPYYEALTYVISYNGWQSDIHARLNDTIDRLLPGVFVESKGI
jgi:hypothetical protein